VRGNSERFGSGDDTEGKPRGERLLAGSRDCPLGQRGRVGKEVGHRLGQVRVVGESGIKNCGLDLRDLCDAGVEEEPGEVALAAGDVEEVKRGERRRGGGGRREWKEGGLQESSL